MAESSEFINDLTLAYNRSLGRGVDVAKLEQFEDLIVKARRGSLSPQERAEAKRLAASVPGKFDPRQAQGWRTGGIGEGDGAQPVVLGSRDSMVDYVREHRSVDSALLDEIADPSRFSLGLMVRGMATGNWTGAELEKRALSEGSNSAGGYLTPEILSAVLVDRLRPAMRVMQAGAQLVPMAFDQMFMARLDTGPSPALAWKSEGAAITTSDNSFSRITFTARTLPFLTLISRELLEDLTEEAARLIGNELVQSIAVELDRACLRGSGVGAEPLGIKGQSGVTLQSLGANGANPSWDDVIDAASNVRATNTEPTAVLWSSRTQQTFDKKKDAQGRFLVAPDSLADVPRLVTNNIPNSLVVGTSSDCSEIYTGNFTHLLLGVRNMVGFELAGNPNSGPFSTRVRILEERYADTLSAGLLTYIRGDVQVAHGGSFNLTTGVRP